MRNIFLCGLVGVYLLGFAALLAPYEAGSAETIVLNDGAIIYGEIQSLQNDVYTVKTESLGTVHVNKQDVRTIDNSGKAAAPSAPDPAELQALQSHMLQNVNLMSMIQALQNDPEVQAVMADPDIVKAIAAGDIAALMNHPKIIALTRNAKMREIIEEAQ